MNETAIASAVNRFASAPIAMLEREIQPMLDARSRVTMRAGFWDDLYEIEPEEKQLHVNRGIATIEVNGALGLGLAEWEKQWCGMTDVDDVSRLVGEAARRSDVTAIVLAMNSPGGSVSGITELAEKIRAARAQKPVIAWSRSICASAAYWIAAQASVVYAAPSAIIGSIGVYTVFYDISKAYDQAGYRAILVKAGANKAIGVPGIPVTDDQLKTIQERVDTMYGMFTADVVSGRGSAVDKASFDGSDWFARAAMERGLIDEIHPDFEAVMQQVAQLVE